MAKLVIKKDVTIIMPNWVVALVAIAAVLFAIVLWLL